MLLRLEQVSLAVWEGSRKFCCYAKPDHTSKLETAACSVPGLVAQYKATSILQQSKVKSLVFAEDHSSLPFCTQAFSHWNPTEQNSATVWAKSQTVLFTYRKWSTTASRRSTFRGAAYFKMDLPVILLMSTALLCICIFIHEWLRASNINVPAHTTVMQIII